MRFRSVVLALGIAIVSSTLTWQWASAQVQDRTADIISGADIGFLPQRARNGRIAGALYIRINAKWQQVEVAFDDTVRSRPLKP